MVAEPITKLTQAEVLLKSHGLHGRIPVPLEELAARLGYRCEAFVPNEHQVDVCGAISYEQRRIFVNQQLNLGRKRFTIAHEIAHAVLHKDERGYKVDFRKTMNTSRDRREVEANQFAADLLMPRGAFLEHWFLGQRPQDLAKIFGASLEAVEIRAKSFGLR